MKKTAIGISGLCLGAFLLLNPMKVSAEGADDLQSIAPNVGAAAMYTLEFTKEECLLAAAEAVSYWGYDNLGIADVSGYLNVRKEPSVSGLLAGKMKAGSACEILDLTEGWAHIRSGEVEGYVSLDYLLTGAEAKIRARELTEDSKELKTAITMTQLRYGEGVTDLRAELAEYAKQFVGNPYVWGGTSLTKGADCSGFVQSVFKNFNIKLSRTSRTQAKDGEKISASKLQPGDLIFYANSSGTINHVAIYIGNSEVVHASSPETGIKISAYNYRTPVKYVDVIQD